METLKFKSKFSDLELGKLYLIEWMDHFTTEDKDSEDCVKHDPVIMKTTGYFIGHNQYYIVLSVNFEKLDSTNNDNTHILRRGIMSIHELYHNGPFDGESDDDQDAEETSEIEGICRP